MDCAKCYKECETVYELASGDYVCQSCYETIRTIVDEQDYLDDAYDRWKDERMLELEEQKRIDIHESSNNQKE